MSIAATKQATASLAESLRVGLNAQIVAARHQPDFQPHVEAITDPLWLCSSSPAKDPMMLSDLRVVLDADADALAECLAAEGKSVATMMQITAEADRSIAFLYTYRGLAQAVPDLTKDVDVETKMRYTEAALNVLQPVVDELQGLHNYLFRAVAILCSEMADLLVRKGKGEGWGDERVWRMICLLDKLLIINGLKSANSGIINDLPKYKALRTKRREHLSTSQSGAGKSREEQEADAVFLTLQMFFANDNSIINHMLDSVFKVKQGNLGAVHVVAEVLKHCVNSYQALAKDKECAGTTPYVKPCDQHTLLRVMPLAVIMLGDQNDIEGIVSENDKAGKEIKIRATLNSALRLMSLKPVVPLFGEMVHVCYHTLSVAPWYNQILRQRSDIPNWVHPADMSPDEAEKRYKKRYEVRHHLSNVRKQHAAHVIQLQALSLSVRGLPSNQVAAETMGVTYRQVACSLQVLGQWTALVLEQTAWKCSRPRFLPNADEAKVGEGAEKEYDRVVKNAYDDDEKDALIEMIAMIKGLGAHISRLSPFLAPIIASYMHYETQDLSQNTLTPMIKHAAKHKKKAVLDMLVKLREISVDWKGGVTPADCPEMVGKRGEVASREFTHRALAPSRTQLEVMRFLINHMCDHADESRGGFFSKAFTSNELSKDDVKELRSWYDSSRIYSHMIDMTGTLQELTDLGNLYFREFYFSIAKSPKLPMSSSLPWILCEHMFKGNHPRLDYFEHIMMPLELYSDAAERALTKLQRAHLYREIEGEVIICVDQLVDMVAKRLYSHFKVLASYSLMSGTYRDFMPTADIPAVSTAQSSFASRSVEILLRLDHLTILGQTFQLSKDISVRIQQLIRKSLLHAILRFEAIGLTAIIELRSLVENSRLTHAMLIEAGADMLEFQSIWDEVNDAADMVSYSSRVLRYCLAELTMDLWPNTSFHSLTCTFLRNSPTFVDIFERLEERAELERFEMQEMQDSNDRAMHLFGNKALSKALCRPRESWEDGGSVFTLEHASAIIELVGQKGVPLILQHCQQRAVEMMRGLVIPYVEKIKDGVSKRINLPSAQNYTLPGVMKYFEAELKPIAMYAALDNSVLQSFRETGNIVCFASLMDQALAISKARSSFFLGPLSTSGGEEVIIKVIEGVEALSGTCAHGLVEQAARNCFALKQSGALLQSVVSHIHSSLIPYMEDFMGGLGEDGIPGGALASGEKPIEFYKLWSALVFLLCLKPKEESGGSAMWRDQTRAEVFGHGTLYTGCIMLLILRQAHRLHNFDFSEHMLREATLHGGGDADTQSFVQTASMLLRTQERVMTRLRVGLNLFDGDACKPPVAFIPPSADHHHQLAALSVSQSASHTSQQRSPPSLPPSSIPPQSSPMVHKPPPPPPLVPPASVSPLPPPSLPAASSPLSSTTSTIPPSPPPQPVPPPPATAPFPSSKPPPPPSKPPPPTSKPPPPPGKPPPPHSQGSQELSRSSSISSSSSSSTAGEKRKPPPTPGAPPPPPKPQSGHPPPPPGRPAPPSPPSKPFPTQ